jgi:hypothetical protein
MLALAFAIGLVPCLPVRAQPVVERPAWKAGDTWHFRKTDMKTGVATTSRRAIGQVRADGGYTVVDGKGRTRDMDADMQLEPEDGAGGASAWQRWPLRVGDAWSWEVPIAMDAGNGTSIFRREVVGVESIVVPAGEFECLRIESTHARMIYDARRMSRPGSSTSTETTTWFCPAVRSHAREVVTRRDGYGGFARSETVLVRYRLAR